MTNGDVIELGSAFLALPELVKQMTKFADRENDVVDALLTLTKKVIELNATVTRLSDAINASKLCDCRHNGRRRAK